MEWQAYARGKIQENQGIKIKTDFFFKATDSLVDIQSLIKHPYISSLIR